MNWQIPLFLNIIFATIRGFLDKKLVDRVNPFLAYTYIVFWVSLFFLAFFFLTQDIPPTIYPEMIVVGIIYAIGIGCFYRAIKISLSQANIFGSYHLIIAVFLAAIFLGEWRLLDPTTLLGLKNISGIILAILGLILFLWTHSKKEEKLEKYFFTLILIFIILNSIGNIWAKEFVNSHGILETVISQSVGGLPLLVIINIFSKNKFWISRENQILALINGIVVTMAVVFFYLAIKAGPLSLILPIQSLAVTVLVVLVGIVLFNESHSLTPNKILGMILGFLGVSLLVM